MQTYIDSCKKESEKHAAYPEQSNVHFENVANITVDSDSITPREKKTGVRKISRKIIKSLTMKMR